MSDQVLTRPAVIHASKHRSIAFLLLDEWVSTVSTRIVVSSDVPILIHNDDIGHASIVSGYKVAWLLESKRMGSKDPAFLEEGAFLQVEDVFVAIPFPEG